MARESRRELDLVKAPEKAIRTGYASHVKVKRLELNQRLEVKYTGCIVSARFRVVGWERISAVG